MAWLKQPVTEEMRKRTRIALKSQPAKISDEPVCDFCGVGTPTVVYASRIMSTGEMRDCWRWMACAPCETAVDAEDFETILRRIKAWLRRQGLYFYLPVHLLDEAAQQSLEQFLIGAIRVELRDNVMRAKRALMNLETDRDRDFRLILRALGVPPDRVGRLKAFLAWAKRSETIGNEDNVNNELDHIRTLLLEAHKCNT